MHIYEGNCQFYICSHMKIDNVLIIAWRIILEMQTLAVAPQTLRICYVRETLKCLAAVVGRTLGCKAGFYIHSGVV